MVLAVLGSLAVLAVLRLAFREGTPLAGILSSFGLEYRLAAAVGVALVIAIAGVGFVRALRQAESIRLTDDGIAIRSPHLGEYVIQYGNLERAGVAPGDALGLKVRSRDELLAGHRGTERQRRHLATMEPFGEWDLLVGRYSLAVPAAELAAILERGRLAPAGQQAEPDQPQ